MADLKLAVDTSTEAERAAVDALIAPERPRRDPRERAARPWRHGPAARTPSPPAPRTPRAPGRHRLDQPGWPQLPLRGTPGAARRGLRRRHLLRAVPHHRSGPRPVGPPRLHGHVVPDRRCRGVRPVARGRWQAGPSWTVPRPVRACAGPVRPGSRRTRPRAGRRCSHRDTDRISAAATRITRTTAAAPCRGDRPDVVAVVPRPRRLRDAAPRDRPRPRCGHRPDRIAPNCRVEAVRRSRRRSSGARSPTSRADRSTSSPTPTNPNRARSRTGS